MEKRELSKKRKLLWAVSVVKYKPAGVKEKEDQKKIDEKDNTNKLNEVPVQ